MVGPDFRSVEAKLRRAEEHFQTLYSEITDWAKDTRHTFVTEVNESHTRHALVAVFEGRDPDPIRWGLIFSDCVNNLRTALDHLVYAISKYQAFNQPSTDVESNCFVIADSSIKFNDRNNKKRLAGLAPEVVTAIEQVQPFNRPHPNLPPLLALLRDFSNTDKHRLLKIANSALVDADVMWKSPNECSPKLFGNPAPIENNSIVCVVTTSEPDPDLTFIKAEAGMQIALWHALRDGDTNALQGRSGYAILLTSFIQEVKYIIAHVKAAV